LDSFKSHRSRAYNGCVPSTLLTLCAVFLLASSSPYPGGQHENHSKSGPPLKLGKVSFPNSGGRAAQEPFLRGIALLHSFEYVDARAAFQEAEAADPAFALAYWCEAFTHSQLGWGIEDLPQARAALARLAPTREQRLAKAGNARERAFGAAVDSFLEGTGSPSERGRAFGAAMAAWSADAPSDVEAMAWAARGALNIRGSSPAAEFVEATERAIALAERVIAANPEHPGGIHYLIHATDSPRFAARGLAAARIYDKLAPDADHALHMPSHIYLQLGMWPDVSASNERAWAASRAWVARGKHGLPDLSWHSLQWLEYGYLQEGRYREARALVDTARQILKGASADMLAGKPDARYAADMLAFRYAAETGDWTIWTGTPADAAALSALSVGAPSVRERQQATSAASFVVAAALGRHDVDAAGKSVEALRTAAATVPAGDPRRTLLDAACAQFDARIASARGDHTAAVDQLTRLSNAAREIGFLPVGPPLGQPLTEVLGAALFDAKRFADAATTYERALTERPNRSAALLGLARAKKAAGDQAGAAAAYGRLAANWKRADPKVKGTGHRRPPEQAVDARSASFSRNPPP
jgi:tetratricopeptide (TPR) repeat protein